MIARNRTLAFSLSLLFLLVLFSGAQRLSAQTLNSSTPDTDKATRVEPGVVEKKGNAGSGATSTSSEERLNLLERAMEQQTAKLDQLQKIILEQQQTIATLAGKLGGSEAPTSLAASSTTREAPAAAASPQAPSVDDRLKKVEARVADIGPVKFSGEIRLRSESFFGLTNSLANGDNPAALGNDLSPRHRLRVRARFAMRGAIGDEFEWGLRLATGSFSDNISTNQTLTDFYNRKPFGLDQAFVSYKPRRIPGLRLQGGKFELPWAATELTIDNDIMIEGLNESYTRGFKNSRLKEIALVAWQSPFLERNANFVRNSNGTVNIDESRRGGRDLALYGAQVRSRFEFSPKVSLNLSAANLFFSGTQFISPVQAFGALLQLPLTITIPASGTTPAQTVTALVSIPRELLVAGAGNLGITTASNNATNRDGRLSSGFNLVDMLARLELKHSERWPVTLTFDFVTNTQTRDVITAGPGGVDLILPNHENNGFWSEVQIGKNRARGDLQFGYTFMRIEKDAVLTPFNMSDITQQSDMRGHRFNFSYTADPRVTFGVIGIITQRPNGLLGPFAATPPGSLNVPTKRLQLDTTIRF